MTSKKCTKCETVKQLSEFSFRKDSGNHRPHCKKCRVIETQLLIHSKEGLAIQIHADQIKSSKRRGYIPPNYTREQLSEWMMSQLIYHKLHSDWIASGYNKMETPSCDRKNDYKPYTFENIQLMTWRENKLKGHNDIKNGINNKRSKAVVQMTMSGIFVKTYHSAKYAGRCLSIAQGGISQCCNGAYKTSGGFRWMYSIPI